VAKREKRKRKAAHQAANKALKSKSKVKAAESK
jgi:hypothetical protein